MSRLAHELIEAGRLGDGRSALYEEPVDIASAMAGAIALVAPVIRNGGHHIAYEPPSEPLRMWADAFRMRQILVNLLGNAAHAHGPRRPHRA